MKVKRVFLYLRNISLYEKLLWLFFILIPVMRVPSLPLVKQKIQYSEIVFVLLFVVWVLRYLNGKEKLQKVPAGFALIVMLSIFLLSFINSRGWLISSITFLGIFYLVCLYFLITQLVTFEDMWWRLLKCWVLISLILAVTGICAYLISFLGVDHDYLLAKHDFYRSVNSGLSTRIISIFRHPAMLATYMHVSIVFSFILAVKSDVHAEKILSYICIALFIITAILTKTRINAGIALTLFLIAVTLPYENYIISFAKYFSFLYAITLFILVSSLTVWWILPVTIHKAANNDTIVFEVNSIQQPYFIMHKTGLKIIKDHPLIGVGMGMFNFESARYITWEESKKPWHVIYPHITEKDESMYKRGTDPHSTYIGWGSETGLLGLGGILFFFIQIIRALVMRIKSDKDMINSFIYKAMLAGLVGFLLNGWYINILTLRHFWILLSMTAIYMQLNSKFYNFKKEEIV